MLLAVVLGSSSVVNAAESNASRKQEIYEQYQDDEQFQMMLKEYGQEYADAFIEDVLNSQNVQPNKMARGGGGNECYQYVTNIKQTLNYNCGSTTVLQSLYGMGYASNVKGSGNAAKIATLDAEYNVKSQGSLYVYQVRDALNKYTGGARKYVYTAGSNITLSSFEDKVATSLTSCKPVVLHAKTKYLSYYGGKNSGHYINIDYINRTTDKVRLVDCNYNSKYYGVHTVTLQEAYNTITKESGRYLIH